MNRSPTPMRDALKPGARQELGSHDFTAEEIICFAEKFDPQPFHLDAEAARNSLYGALCASGWHTTAVWMGLQAAELVRLQEAARAAGEIPVEFGPAPGIRDLKWFRPVYAGDTISYWYQVGAVRASQSKTGWHIMSGSAGGENQDGKPVVGFTNAVFISFVDAD